MKKAFSKSSSLEHNGVIYKKFSGVIIDSKEVFDTLPLSDLVIGQMTSEESKAYLDKYENKIFELGGMDKIIKIVEDSIAKSKVVDEDDEENKIGENDGLSGEREKQSDNTPGNKDKQISSSFNR